MPETLDFDRETLPWIDQEAFDDELQRNLAAGAVSENEAETLRAFREQGYFHLRGLIEMELIDGLLADYERAWRERPPVFITSEGDGVLPFPKIRPREDLNHHHYRLMDFHEVSSYGERVILHPGLLRWVKLILGAPPVAMQSLFFEYSSEQRAHQDFPYVSAQILSHLVGCWVACEDVSPETGPLFYYPGSHRLPKMDWGGGELRLIPPNPLAGEPFEQFLVESCARAGLESKTVCAKKGDVILWHSALVHGGSEATDRQRTRKSFVAHYSTAQAYPVDRRNPHSEPRKVERNGGTFYVGPPAAT